MKKSLIAVLGVIVLAALCLGLSACYVSKPAKMSDLVGTYKLTVFTRTPKAEKNAETGEPSEVQPVDMIKTRGITAYLVVKDDGYGYYVYRDDEKALSVEAVKIKYTMDEDDKTQVKEITYDNGYNTAGDGSPLKGRETLGLTFTKKTKKLSYSFPAYEGLLIKREYSQSVSYEKVSGANDLSYVNKELKANLKAEEFALKNLNGLIASVSSYYDSTPYVYYALEFSADKKTATTYYALKADEVAHKTENQAVAVAYGETCATVTVGNVSFTRSFSSTYPTLTSGLNFEENGSYLFLYSYYISEEDADKTTDEILAGVLDAYVQTRTEAEAAAGPTDE